MNKKINLAILTGGTSEEHEISLLSGYNIANSINLEKYNLYIIGIHKNGDWHCYPDLNYLNNKNNPKNISLKSGEQVILLPNKKKQLYSLSQNKILNQIDVVFSILHGKDGEDGSMQGLLNLTGIPYVGSKVVGSCLGMDKHYTKQILLQENIPTAKFMTLTSSNYNLDNIVQYLGNTIFVKPANQGSSVGVSKAKNKQELEKAINFAFQFDNKVLVEEYIKGRELECAILGNNELIASPIGEIITHHDFYSYDAKYVDPNGATTKILTANDLNPKIINQIQDLAKKAFLGLGCKGLARVDFFLTEDDKLFINEINTLPGFTNISMYPQLFLTQGYSYQQLIEKLIDLALE
jgi:D-alanine-D-alanine ligase